MAYNLAYWQFFDRTNILKQNQHFYYKFKSSLEVQMEKRKVSDNLSHNTFGLYNILVPERFTTNKTKLDIQYRKLGIRVAERVAK